MCKGIIKEMIKDNEISYEVVNSVIKKIVINNIMFDGLDVDVNEFDKEKLLGLGSDLNV